MAATAWQLVKRSDNSIVMVPAGTPVAYGVNSVQLGSGLGTIQNNIENALLSLHASTDQTTLLLSQVMGGTLRSTTVATVDDKLHWLSTALVAGLGVGALVDAAGGAADAGAIDAATGVGGAGATGAAAGVAGTEAAVGAGETAVGAGEAAVGAGEAATALTSAAAIAAIWTAITNPKMWLRALEILGGVVAIFMALKSLTGVSGPPIVATVAKAAAA